jgi:hypothetical protein
LTQVAGKERVNGCEPCLDVATSFSTWVRYAALDEFLRFWRQGLCGCILCIFSWGRRRLDMFETAFPRREGASWGSTERRNEEGGHGTGRSDPTVGRTESLGKGAAKACMRSAH